MTTPLTSVASAAIIGGDLIMGLSDGSIINCGRVQGPQGLTGDRGPMGATGRVPPDGCHPTGATGRVPPDGCHQTGATGLVPPGGCQTMGATINFARQVCT